MRFLFLLLISLQVHADPPSWFSKDEKAGSGWTFYCDSEAQDEKTALAMAQADCSRKMCMLFGVVVKYSQETTETLKDAKVDSKVIESCPEVRIVGRQEKKKLVDCEDSVCRAYVSQFYPMAEYELEKKRLNNPKIAPELAGTIIIREGNETFRDPKKCKDTLRNFSLLTGVGEEQRLERVKLLKSAETDCKELDYRNFNLQNELQQYLTNHITARGNAAAQFLLPLVSGEKDIVKKVSELRRVEEISQKDSLRKSQKLLTENYDSLWVRGDLVAPYMEELRTCRAHSKIVRQWPSYFTDEVTACASSTSCQTTSILMLRYSYAGCVCRVSAPQMTNPCVSVLVDHMNKVCPGEMTEACFRSMSVAVAEKMKIQLHDPQKKGNP